MKTSDAVSDFRLSGFAVGRVFRVLSLIVAMIGLTQCAAAQDRSQVKIVDVIWGFDGRVVVGQFMPLSILVDNLSDQPVEATAGLLQMRGLISAVGGELVQPVYIGPNARRWVQFYPFINLDPAGWRFELRGEERTWRFDPIDQPRSVFDRNRLTAQEDPVLPAVILDPPGFQQRAPTTVKHMPSEIFPPYATAMNGLRALFLDDVPDWETPRQEALLSWLRSGGQLHLLLNSNRQPLRFSGVLSSLNEPFSRFAVGSGTVVRHEIQRNELNEQIVAEVVRAPRASQPSADDGTSNAGNAFNTGFQDLSVVHDDDLFMSLRDLSRPEHSWAIIFMLSVVYIGMIFPGCWILSKQRRVHFLIPYAAITGLAVIFSLIFLVIGRRGYGESTSLHSLMIARAEDETHWNTLLFANLFVTSGNQYQIEDPGNQTLIVSGTSDERVDAAAVSGNSAVYDSRIPPFSSQSVIARRRMTTASWEMSVEDFARSGDHLTRFSMTFGQHFPVGDDIQYFLVHRSDLHTAGIDRASRRLRMNNDRRHFTSFCVPQSEDSGMRLTWNNSVDTDQNPFEAFAAKALPLLASRTVLDDFVATLKDFSLPADQIRLMIYAPIPDDFDLKLNADVNRDGRILFVRTLSLQSAD